MKKTAPVLLLVIFFFLLPQSYLAAQDKLSLKFGKITAADFDLSKQNFDSSASGVYIADIGSSEFEGNSKGRFSLVFKRHARIKILKKDGFDLASVEIPLYTSGNSEEKLSSIKAATYHLENGNVVATKLEESGIFKDKINKNLIVKKFTLPAVKEGCIIEFAYTITSDFLFNLQPWQFQGRYPRLWSEYNVSMPEFFNYVFLSQGSNKFNINTRKETRGSFTVVEPGGASANSYYKLDGRITDSRWVMKNVPALKEEPFTTSLQNHISKIEFQLSEVRYPNTVPQNIMGNWEKASEELLKHEDFGATLSKNNNWLDDEIKNITNTSKSKLEKAQKIYAYVRDNFTCTNNGMYLTTSLKNTFKTRNGSAADINLLLIAMLKHEDIQADPVLLSTREHGYTHEIYPLLDRFNYVIAKVIDNDQAYFLDATKPKLGFNYLPIKCYNGHSRIISADPQPVFLDADSVKEWKTTLVNFGKDEKGKYVGSLTSNLGYYESLSMREKLAEKGKDNVFKSMKSSFTDNIELSDFQIDSLATYEKPLAIKYNIKLNNIGTENILYINPMFGEGYKDNYFKSAERAYPVEMPYTIDETYVMNMFIPEGYEVDELPKSTKVALNEGEGYFEYIMVKNENMIQMRSRVQLKKANFFAEDYEGLRGFFDLIVKKHNEQIVLKKKK
ncbi:transglutaminase domain-containing protein [Flavisolibacter tropicus]|uniref:transglutaminase domain-containing protein n=1 Tax=Flavisolibacter tropicus TaxID=1492898 RepID=UPI0008359E8F|nr:DUF3857 domain-containing protein [Flavisolibacter tropicus]